MMILATLPPYLNRSQFNYFDVVVVVWLIIGLFRGRKRGMSQELLPTLEWIGIVVACGLLYWPLYPYVKEVTLLSTLWSCLLAYGMVAMGIYIIYMVLKQNFAEKLVARDPFGSWEFYLGMAAGVVRFGCMVIVFLALINARIVSAAERAQTEKFQAANFSDIRFPTWGEFQQDVLFQSFTGKLVQKSMRPMLIATTDSPSDTPPHESLAQKSNKAIDYLLTKPKKK